MRTPPLETSVLAPLGPARRERARPRQTFLQVLDEGAGRGAGGPSPPVMAPAPPGLRGNRAGDELRALVTRTLRAEDRIDRLIASAAAGKTFSAGQLLALQATAFRYSQTVEVLSRAADRLVGSIKQTLGTQV